MPFFLEAAILSRTRSPMTSRSNWAKDSSTFSVSRPMLVVVLNCCVIDSQRHEGWAALISRRAFRGLLFAAVAAVCVAENFQNPSGVRCDLGQSYESRFTLKAR